jgi:FdhD protein
MSGPTAIAPLQRWSGGSPDMPQERLREDEDLVAAEVPVALSYNRQPHVVMMTTPRDLEDFALGFSLTEGLIESAAELLSCRLIPRSEGIEVALTVNEDAAERIQRRRRNLTGRTGCGLCGAERLEQAVRTPPTVPEALQVTHHALQKALAALSAQQPLQAATGAVHAAAWCLADGTLHLVREDVGRHNALDKLIGALTRAGGRPEPGFLLVSSRASYEMVQKAASVGMELLMAVSAPTSLAIELAQDCGLTLVGFARPGRHNVYTAPGRLASQDEQHG